MKRFERIRQESKVTQVSPKSKKIVKIGSKEYAIESGIEMPKRVVYNQKTKWKRVLAAMDVGDSVVVDTETDAGCLRAAARSRHKLTTQRGIKVEVKKGRKVTVATKYRVWRLE